MHTPFAARGRRENAPSSFVPLQQPKYRSSRDRESVRDSMSRNEGSLSVQTPESTHAVKVLDESWNWTSRGSDVGGVRKGCGSLNSPAVLWWRSCLLTGPSNSLACPLCLHYLYPPPPSTLPLPPPPSLFPLIPPPCPSCPQSLMEQPDFLVVGCLGLQGVGKSTVMSILAGSRTGSGR